MKKSLLLLLAALSINYAMAADSPRNQKIAQIIEAQGLVSTYDQQLSQASVAARQYGDQMFQKMAASGKKPNAQMQAAYQKFVQRVSSMWTAKELVAQWSAHYGQGLSDSDLDGILAYYQSPVGKKDVAASRAAAVRLSQYINDETQKRVTTAMSDFLRELQAAAQTR